KTDPTAIFASTSTGATEGGDFKREQLTGKADGDIFRDIYTIADTGHYYTGTVRLSVAVFGARNPSKTVNTLTLGTVRNVAGWNRGPSNPDEPDAVRHIDLFERVLFPHVALPTANALPGVPAV